jgi:hypothetical protein
MAIHELKAREAPSSSRSTHLHTNKSQIIKTEAIYETPTNRVLNGKYGHVYHQLN